MRPRGTYLEVRYLDAQPVDRVEQVVEVLATLAYDADVRARVLHELEPLAPPAGRLLAGRGGGLPGPDGGGGSIAGTSSSSPTRSTALLADIDATVGLMTAAQSEGAEVWVCGPEDLAVVEGRLRARARRVVLHERTRGDDHRWRIASPWYAAGAPGLVDVAETFEVAMLRIDPPVDARYLHTTYLLDLAAAAGVRVVNHPAGVRALHEKLLALALPDLSPATVVGACPYLVEDFVRRHGRVVLKPVDGFAGTDVWLVDSGPGLPGARGVGHPGGTTARDRPGVPARRGRRQQAALPARWRDRRRGAATPVRRGLPDRRAGRARPTWTGRRADRRRRSPRCSSRTASPSQGSTSSTAA